MTAPTRLAVVRVYADASRRGTAAGWGAAIVAGDRKPHVMGGSIAGERDTVGLEAVAAILARDAARRWLRRHGMRAELLVVHTDNQSAADHLARRLSGARVTFRWVARDHRARRLAHRRARLAPAGAGRQDVAPQHK
jgi:ribonuclease HI